MDKEIKEVKKIIYYKDIDLYIAYFSEEVRNPLETIPSPFLDGNILFEVDTKTKELVRITIYDFSVVRRKMLRQFLFLFTQKAIKNWLKTLAEAFQAGMGVTPQFAPA